MSSLRSKTGRRVVRRYALYQLPELVLAGLLIFVLVRTQVVSSELGWIFFGLWLGKEVVLFRFVRGAYEPSEPSATRQLEGKVGRVTRPLVGTKPGWVRIGSELWSARLADGSRVAEVGTEVEVQDVEGLTLVVRCPALPGEAKASSG